MGIACTLLLFLFGTLWGSFFYTLALRYSQGSFQADAVAALTAPSRCPRCGAPVPYLYLVPLLGYTILRGKCRACREGISPAYPAFEVFNGALLVFFVLRRGPSVESLLLFAIAGLSVAIAVIDVKTLTIPTPLVMVFILLSAYPVYLNGSAADNLMGGLGMFLFFLVILILFPGGFGGGDVKFAAAIGLLSGVEHSIVVLEIALIVGSLSGIVYAAATGKGLRTKIPFAPFLACGLIISLLYGREIILLYRRWIY